MWNVATAVAARVSHSHLNTHIFGYLNTCEKIQKVVLTIIAYSIELMRKEKWRSGEREWVRKMEMEMEIEKGNERCQSCIISNNGSVSTTPSSLRIWRDSSLFRTRTHTFYSGSPLKHKAVKHAINPQAVIYIFVSIWKVFDIFNNSWLVNFAPIAQ